MNTRTLLTGFLGIVTLAWAWDVAWMPPLAGATPWVLRQHGLYLTGLYAMALMSLTMVLATRPIRLESMLGGMDKIYRLHKYAGMLALGSGVLHWLLKLASGPLKTWIGALDRPAKESVLALMLPARGIAKDLGEWTLYLLLALLILALWKRFPYRTWRRGHRIMPVLYLALAFHTLALMPLTYWAGLSGVLQAVLLLAGTWAAMVALAGRIGSPRRHRGHIRSIQAIGAQTVEVCCDMDRSWPGHAAGQFAFVTFDPQEGAHPFTIASAQQGQARQLTFQIKALGDYTRTLADRLMPGQAVQIEGPYGRFSYERRRHDARQAWVAGGIGITPFLAWLEALRLNPARAPHAQLHYCVRDAQHDPLVARVRALCAQIPAITVQVHDAARQQRLDAQTLLTALQADAGDPIDIWFCGPAGFADSLRSGFRHAGATNAQIWQEAFAMR